MVIRIVDGKVKVFGDDPPDPAVEDGVVMLDGDTVTGTSTVGTYATIHIQGEDSILRANDVEITNSGQYVSDGELSVGIRAHNGSQVTLVGGSVTATGSQYTRALFAANAAIDVDGTKLSTAGDQSDVVHAYAAGVVSLKDATISSQGDISHGIYSELAIADRPQTRISSTGGSITTAGVGSYGAFAELGATIELTGTTIKTTGGNSSGIVAGTGSTVTVKGGSVTTSGNDAYGLHANPDDDGGGPDNAEVEGVERTPGTINANGVNIVTSGLNGFGAFAESNTTIDIANSTIRTSGEQGYGLIGNNDRGQKGGVIRATDVDIVSSGKNASAVLAAAGAEISLSGGSRLVSEQSAAVRLIGSAYLGIKDTEIVAAGETFSSLLTKSGENQTIFVGTGTIATQNNGTLLRVSRENRADGIVDLYLQEGSTTQGNIVDTDARNGGGTDVFLEEGASWSGQLFGVRNYITSQSSNVIFEDEADIEGNLETAGSAVVFSDKGGSIGGDVTLTSGSTTTGGSIEAPVFVAGEVEVDPTSELGGNWEIAGDLTNAGIISPGNSVGRIVVGGDSDFAPGSRYDVEIYAAGDADLISVGGVAHLGGTVAVTPFDGFRLGHDYVILTAQGGIVGSFGGIIFSEDYAFIDAHLGGDANNVTVRIDRNAMTYASAARSANQAAVAIAADNIPVTSDLGGALAFMTSQEASHAFDLLSGEIHASARSALIEQSHALAGSVNERIQRTFERADSSLGVWMSGYGDRTGIDGNGNAARLSWSGGGVLVGADVDLGQAIHAGIVAGYGRSHIKAGYASSLDSDNYLLGLYGGGQWGDLAVRAGLLHSWFSLDGDRSLDFSRVSDWLHADYDARSLQLFGEVGYDFKTGSGTIQPFANVAYVHLAGDAFGETGGMTALSLGKADMDTAFTTLGVRVRADLPFETIPASFKGMIGWRHAFGDVVPAGQAQLAGADWFSISGTAIDRDVAVIEAGIEVDLTAGSDKGQARFGVNYSGAFGENTTRNGIKVDLVMKF